MNRNRAVAGKATARKPTTITRNTKSPLYHAYHKPAHHPEQRCRDARSRAWRLPKQPRGHRFELTEDEIAAIDALDTGERGGPDPEKVDTEMFDFEIED